jgi:hypothetical protein
MTKWFLAIGGTTSRRLRCIGMKRLFTLFALVACSACGAAAGEPAEPADPTAPVPPDATPTNSPAAPCTPPTEGNAPTYTELFDQYFAVGKPGHCATAGCHADPGHNVWLCGTTKDSCYAGMVQIGLVNPTNPIASLIGDATKSPVAWVNPTGPMPFDAAGPFPPGRDAILAWVAACAQNN